MSKRIWLPVILAVVLVIGVAGAVFAQSATPEAPNAATPGSPLAGKGFRFGGPLGWFGLGMQGKSNWTEYDAVAKALNLSPEDLFGQLHSGKSLSDIAAAQKVDINKVLEAARAAQTQAMEDAIKQAVQDGRLTQAQADWLLQGLKNGWTGKPGFFGRGFRGGMRGMDGGARGGMRMLPRNGQQQPSAQPTPNA